MSDITVGDVWVDKVDKSTLEILRGKREGRYYVNTSDGGECYVSHANLIAHYEPQKPKDDKPRAVQILTEAVAIMAERGKSYDKSGGEAERSMPKIVAMFNALTGHELTPEQGWKFMCCLKLARSEQGEYREDNYLDGAAYMALAGEEAEAVSE
ncbi:DUF6378 domain-containing protein [Psychrobacter glaciei]|uniref:DUF6378 domain-containing protein n=1 Tax=Psychrobacter glaciei TaxID=619771 RepID=UPI003F4886BE